jgi:hypothetical protein
MQDVSMLFFFVDELCGREKQKQRDNSMETTYEQRANQTKKQNAGENSGNYI